MTGRDDPFGETRCEGVGPTEEELSAYLEGDVDAARGASLEAHLASCARCRDAMAALRALVARCHEAPRPCPGEDCVRRAIAAAREELVRKGLLSS